MSQPEISIIVPVYNVEKHLNKSIESILSQTFTDWELILIDDGSTDSSGLICDQYVKGDKRISVYHTENKGVSAARNLGIDKAIGNWIVFVDSDDWLDKNCLSFSYQLAIKNKVQILQYSYVHVYSDGRITHLNRESTNVMNGESYIKNGTYNLCVWASIIEKSFIKDKHIKFVLGEIMGQDVHFMAKALTSCERVMYINEELLFYYHNTASISYVRDCRTTLRACYMFIEIGKSFPILKSFCDKEIMGYINELICISNVSENEITSLYKKTNLTGTTFTLKNSYFFMAKISPRLAFYIRKWLFKTKRFFSTKKINGLT